MTNQPFNYRFASAFVLGLIGFYCLSCSMFYRQFAELSIQLPSLTFPVFIGEIFLFICALIFCCQWPNLKGRIPQVWRVLLIAYCGWFLAKAMYGYFTHGPLAFRNAAQFYYVLFALAGYCFFRKEFFTQRVIIGLLALMLMAKIIVGVSNYFILPYFILSTVLALNIRNPWIKYPAFIPIIYIPPQNLDFPTLVPFVFFFMGGRGRVMGQLVAFLFLFVVMTFTFLRVRAVLKVGFLAGLVILMMMSLVKYMDKNSLKSMFDAGQIVKLYKEHDEIIEKRKNDPFRNIPVNLYSKESIALSGTLSRRVKEIGASLRVLKPKELAELQSTVKDIVETSKVAFDEATEQVEEEKKVNIQSIVSSAGGRGENKQLQQTLTRMISEAKYDDVKKIIAESDIKNNADVLRQIEVIEKEHEQKIDWIILEEKAKVFNTVKETIDNLGLDREISIEESLALASDRTEIRDIGTSYYNILFRLFIWRDMMRELISERDILFGVNMGKPQRSRSIEVFGWAAVEWEKDGWITSHNSFLHYIYRGGVVGLAVVIGVWGILFFLIRKFILTKSFVGILMAGIFIYWMVIANFLVFLELPYNAIPFWSLLGMLMAYSRTLPDASRPQPAPSVHQRTGK